MRDYIRVQNVAQAHMVAMHALLQGADIFTINVGTGQGHSVLDVARPPHTGRYVRRCLALAKR